MGTVQAGKGLDDPGFTALLDLQKKDEKCWVKITGLERASAGGKPFHDAVPFAKALIDNAPDRVIWGTDWPHPNVKIMPNDGEIVDLIPLYAPDRDRPAQAAGRQSGATVQVQLMTMMYTPTIPPPDPNTRTPKFKLPKLSCDAHCHIFGPGAKYPYAPDRSYTPPDAPLEDFRALHAKLGVERAVIVNASVHGTDNRSRSMPSRRATAPTARSPISTTPSPSADFACCTRAASAAAASISSAISAAFPT